MIKQYESIAALRADYIAKCSNTRGYNFANNEWYGNESETLTLQLTDTGDTRLVAEAERQMSKLDNIIETPKRVWDRNVAGAYCCIPDVLAGRPTPMRRQVVIPDDHAPITILVVTTSSAGINAATLAKRGTTILALVMALTRVRPVTLHQLAILNGRNDGTGETIITAQINTHPLDLATACYVLTSAGFARRLT
jgi:hypothetical protein